jgi:hypothetical protein
MVRAVVHRWRTLAREIDPDLRLNGISPDFVQICRVGALLLQRPIVGYWLARRYPLVLVDELQDCSGDHLAVIKAIEKVSHLIAAADDFQDLRTVGLCEAVGWLRSSGGTRTLLSGSKRTRQRTILEPANALRDGQDCGDLLGGRLTCVLNANVGAGAIARALSYNGVRDAAILSPSGPDASAFVRDVIARLVDRAIHPKGLAHEVGPFNIEWEAVGDSERQGLLRKLEADDGTYVAVERIAEAFRDDGGVGGELAAWAVNQSRKKGITRFSSESLAAATDRILQSRRAFQLDRPSSIVRAMTINQAKNREFEGVVVLWPFAIGGTIDSHRRKLYNAITRAKRWVWVVLQESSKEPRIGKPPFSKTPKSVP